MITIGYLAAGSTGQMPSALANGHMQLTTSFVCRGVRATKVWVSVSVETVIGGGTDS